MSIDTTCVGPWAGSPRKDMNYDIGVLGAGYDPANVLTCLCCRCGAAWSYDSPSAECRGCERETLIEYLQDENRRLKGEPPLHRKPPAIGPYTVVYAPTFIKSLAELSGDDEKTIRAEARKRGNLPVRSADEDVDGELLRDWMKEYAELALDDLPEPKQAAWREWWATREQLPLPPRAGSPDSGLEANNQEQVPQQLARRTR